jgi:DNA-binding beta-propeller fold protein YncE
MAGTSTLRYEVVEGWEQLPAGYVHRDVAGVAVDGEDRVYLICRGDHPIIAYDRNGKFLGSWGEGQFTYRTHGITVGPDEMLYCTDDGNHTVRKFTPKGKLLMTLGTMDRPADTGYDGKDYMTITKPADGFNRPTNLAVGPKGDLYVSDGYGNCRVHQFGPNGERKRSWGEGQFTYRTHGITVGPDEMLYCTDDGNHTVRKFTPKGKLLLTLGTMDKPADTGYDGKDYMTITKPADGFNRPTNLAVGPKGDLYVSDGYGNCRVHQFGPNGELKRSWGVPGTGPGQFYLPHGIAAAADGRIFVCDRENDRIQIFSPDGEYLSEWTDTQRPTHLVFDPQGRAYVSELWWHTGDSAPRQGRKITEPLYGRVSVFDREGRLLTRWGTPEATAPGSFAAPHGIAVDSRGDIYVAEVTWTFAVSRGRVPAGCHTFQKFSLKG